MAPTKVLNCSHGQALPLSIANKCNSQKGVRYVNLRLLDRQNMFSLAPFAPENLVSRDRFSRPVPRQPLILHT